MEARPRWDTPLKALNSYFFSLCIHHYVLANCSQGALEGETHQEALFSSV